MHQNTRLATVQGCLSLPQSKLRWASVPGYSPSLMRRFPMWADHAAAGREAHTVCCSIQAITSSSASMQKGRRAADSLFNWLLTAGA